MFGHKSEPSRIWSFGCKVPTEGIEFAREQLRLAHKYRNKLVEIELKRREQSAEVVRACSPDLARLEQEYALAEAVLVGALAGQKKRNAVRRGRAASKEDREKIVELRRAKKDVYAQLKEAKALAYKSDTAREKLDSVNEADAEERRQARASSGLYFGTYLQVEQSMGSCRRGAPPKFMRWQGGGKLAVQIQHSAEFREKNPEGMTFNMALKGTDSRLIIASMDAKMERAEVKVRIGSDDKHDPIYLHLRCKFHRMPPSDAKIKWVYVTCRRVACHEQWTLHLVLSRAAGWSRADLAESGSCGVDVGWRLMEDGSLRVAVFRGDDGKETEIRLPAHDVDRWERSETLRSIRDEKFNIVRDRLCSWISGTDKALLPDWFKERTDTLAQWRSEARLASLVLFWRNNRFAGDTVSHDYAEVWRRQDKHLYEWEANQLRKAIAWRTNLYRNLAAEFSRKYHTVRVENTDWRELQKNPDPEDEKGKVRPTNYRRIAACGDFLRILKERFAETLLVRAAHTTHTCHACGRRVVFDQVGELRAKCECGAEWDQDENAARNIASVQAVA